MKLSEVASQYGVKGMPEKAYDTTLGAYMEQASIDWLATSKDVFIKAVGGDFKSFGALARFVGKSPGWQDRAYCVRVVNTSLADDALSVANAGPFNLDAWKRLCQIVEPLSATDKQWLKSFVAAKGKPDDLRKVVEHPTLTGNPAATYIRHALLVLVKALSCGAKPKWITPDAMPNLIGLYDVGKRPDSGFHSFLEWGSANYGSVQENIEGHFLKHVCAYSNKLPPEPVYPAEGPWWWQKFNISLRKDATAALIDHVGDAAALDPFFGGGGDILRHEIRSFLESGIVGRNPRLQAFLIERGADVYRDYALSLSKVMSTVRVTCGSGKAFICGYHGDVYICGRNDGARLGISSCYKSKNISEKKSNDQDQTMWNLRA